jgi:medium-chain acyl-[acyl-carrier-protein] hydrolase
LATLRDVMNRFNPWLGVHPRRSARRVRLLCIPFAGGSAAAFRDWPAIFPPHVEVCPLELPGRGTRFKESTREDLIGLAGEIHAALEPLLGEPLAIFGHSLGAMLAFELARLLSMRGPREPLRLFISGQRAPHRSNPKPPLHNLPDERLVEELRKLGGTLPEVFENADLLSLMLPVLRSDFRMGETYKFAPSAPLGCPISVFGGTVDEEVCHEDLTAWREYTMGSFDVRCFPGNHFFLHTSARLLVAEIVEHLDWCAAAAGGL